MIRVEYWFGDFLEVTDKTSGRWPSIGETVAYNGYYFRCVGVKQNLKVYGLQDFVQVTLELDEAGDDS